MHGDRMQHPALRLATSLLLASWMLLLGAASCRDNQPTPEPYADDKASAPEQAAKAIMPTATAGAPHFAFPVPAQGEAPADWSELEKSLLPKDCGSCHPAQFADWSTTYHSKAYGPGLVGQFGGFNEASAASCYRCHAPLTEQQSKLPDAQGAYHPNPLLNEELRSHGVTCAVCHVRNNQRLGPPPKDGVERDMSVIPHDGFVIEEQYTKSEFCSYCHQFPDTWRSFNGKLLENTYNEWKASPQAAEGKQCQTCHMPDRRHLFRGIHDKETSAAGFTFEATAKRDDTGRVTASMSLKNTGVGHMAPTYTTPRIYLDLISATQDGQEMAPLGNAYVVGRQVILGTSNDREAFDTRIAPGDAARREFGGPVLQGTAMVIARVRVEPDYHYEGLFEGLLKNLKPGSEDHQKITAALAQAKANHYVLFEKRITL